MSRKIFLLAGVFLAVASMAEGAEAPASPHADATGVLLLRNGQVIEGQIEHSGDYYTVTLPDQELQIRAASVEFACHDLREGYRQKKAAIQPDDIEQHLQLFLWCERHGLLDYAGDELTAAEAIDREHPMISVLRRRLKVEMQQRKDPRRSCENGPLPPTDEQLDRMTRGMPPGTVETFVQVVQPILLNHCPGAVGFMLPEQKRLQLMRPPLGESPSRRITQRNLYAVLECIDWNSPGESPLLKATVGSGAVAAVGSFPGKYSLQYHKLAQWVYQVAQKPMPPDDAGGIPGSGGENASFADLAGGSPTPLRLAAMSRSAPGHGKDRADAKPKGAADRADKSKASDDSHAPRRIPVEKAAAKAIDAIDPYDPATFNNQANAPTTLATPAARVLKGDK